MKIPENAPAGIYSGNVTITAMDSVYQIPVTMRVRNFEIPKQISLRSSFWMFRRWLNDFYKLSEIDVNDYMKWIDFALEHRVNPIDTMVELGVEYAKIIKTDPVTKEQVIDENPDWTKLDIYIDHMVRGGANTIHLGFFHNQIGWFGTNAKPQLSPGHLALFSDYLKVLRKHYIRRGVFDMHYCQPVDENIKPEYLDAYKVIHKNLPDVKTLLTGPGLEKNDSVLIPCPISYEYDEKLLGDVVKKGGEYWWYVCSSADIGKADFLIAQSAVQHRALWWQTWHFNAQGLLNWGLNYYGSSGPEVQKFASQSTPLPDLDHMSMGIGGASGNGYMIYPGPTPGMPLSSVRFEVMRDAEEDYEYLILLDKLLKAKPESKAAANARKALDNARSLTTSVDVYELDESKYLKVRDEVAAAIENLLSL